MIKELTCIVCPIGCSLSVEENSGSPDNLSVTGNRCQRGAVYALEEIRSPKRVVTATCGILFPKETPEDASHLSDASPIRRFPVKTASPCPREMIPALLKDIYNIKVSLPVKAGDVVIADWKGQGFDVIATRTVDVVSNSC